MADTYTCIQECDDKRIKNEYMKIENRKVVELIYELKVGGEVVDKTTSERPLDFIQGMGYLLPLFEKNIEGKEPGEKFEFTLEPKDGYGEWQLEKIIDLPKTAFEVDGKIREDLLVVGSIVPLMNPMGGVIPAKVMEIGTDTVKMDLNHPMAGKTLNFSGEILTVRDATEKELTEGLHGEFSGEQQHECNCGCGHECGDGECGGCGEHEGGCCEHKEEKKGGCKGKCHKN